MGGILLFDRGLATVNNFIDKYTITNKRIKTKKGVLGGNITKIGLPHIDNISLRQNFSARICGYGDLLVGAAGGTGSKIIIKNIRHPQEIMILINNLRAGSGDNAAQMFDKNGKPGKYQKCRQEDIADWRIAGLLIILGIIAFALFLSSLILVLPW